jgi:hypothetical protein
VWIHAPLECSPSSRESGGLISESNWLYLALEQSALWRGKPTAQRNWLRVCKTVPFMKRLSGQTLEPSKANRGVEQWIASLGAFHARTCPMPEKAQDSQESDQDSGGSTTASFAKYDHDTSLWRTSQLSLTGELTEFSGTWPKQGTMRHGECFPLKKQVPRTKGKDSSSWPTPRNCTAMVAPVNPSAKFPQEAANEQPQSLGWETSHLNWPTARVEMNHATLRTNRNKGAFLKPQEHGILDVPLVPIGDTETLQQESALRDARGNVLMEWPTPAASLPNDGEPAEKWRARQAAIDNPYHVPLGIVAKEATAQWATPTSRDWKDTGCLDNVPVNCLLGRQAAKSELGYSHPDQTTGKDGQESSVNTQNLRLRLNPLFVTWLMNLPIGWVSLKPLDRKSYEHWAMQSIRQLAHLLSQRCIEPLWDEKCRISTEVE